MQLLTSGLSWFSSNTYILIYQNGFPVFLHNKLFWEHNFRIQGTDLFPLNLRRFYVFVFRVHKISLEKCRGFSKVEGAFQILCSWKVLNAVTSLIFLILDAFGPIMTEEGVFRGDLLTCCMSPVYKMIPLPKINS